MVTAQELRQRTMSQLVQARQQEQIRKDRETITPVQVQTVKPVDSSQTDLYNKVIYQIQREAEGKKGSILDTSEERELRARLIQENPDIKRAIQRGMAKSIGEKAIVDARVNETIRQAEEQTGQSLSQEVRKDIEQQVRYNTSNLLQQSVLTPQIPIKQPDPEVMSIPVEQSMSKYIPVRESKVPYQVKSLFQPAVYPSEYEAKGLTPRQQGFEAAKGIFVAPVRAFKEVLVTRGQRRVREGDVIIGNIGQAAGTLVPQSPAGILGTYGGGYVLSRSSPFIRTGVGGTFSVFGTKTALDSEYTPPERIAGGIVGGLGILGVVSETSPFIKGGITRITTKTSPVISETVEIGGKPINIQTIKEVKPSLDIRIIPEARGIPKPKSFRGGEGAIYRGGFGFSPKEQIEAFGGKTLRLATSQRGLDTSKGSIEPIPEISPLGFFFTPADPYTGIAQTRASRLGLTDFFGIPKVDSGITFKKAAQKPQIFITKPTQIITYGETGYGGKARISPKGSTELEATSFSTLTITEELRPTILRGQKVEVYEAILGESNKKPKDLFGQLKKGETIRLSSINKRYVSPTGLLSSTLATTTILKTAGSKNIEIFPPSKNLINNLKSKQLIQKTDSKPNQYIELTGKYIERFPKKIVTTKKIKPPTGITIKPPIPIRTTTPPPPPPKIFITSKPKSAKTQVGEIFEAFGRVKGRDVKLGEFRTKVGAEQKLKTFQRQTLAASGFVTKGGTKLRFEELGEFQTGEFTPSKRDVTRVVQKRGYRLGTRSEVGQIQRAKRGSSKKIKWY